MIPAPVSFAPGSGRLDLTDLPLSAEPALSSTAAWLRGVLHAALPPGDGGIRLTLDPAIAEEGYRLTVAADGVRVRGGSPAGVFHGLQTMRQLLPPAALRRARIDAGPLTLPWIDVRDEPRFSWRGVSLDVARHFMPVSDVLRFIDLLAFHKLNVLHLHLTDDQGWRFEVPGWPRLTSVGAWRPRSMLGSSAHGRFDDRPHGGFYRADDLREIVAFARDRHVTVVPEVDLPGHMQAAIAAYPELGNGATPPVREAWGISPHLLNVSETALRFGREVLDQVCAIFPSAVIGIGGDECPPGEWAASAAVRSFRERHGLADERAVHAWWIARMAEHLAARGRRALGWDEILDGGAPPGAIVSAWRGPAQTARAARAGHDVVSCPDTSVYLDYRQSEDPGEPTPVGTVLTVADVYAFEPVPPGLTPGEQARVIGAQANIWTEHMESARRVDYMAFPRLCAFAEAVWHKGGDFPARLAGHLPRLDALGVNYRPPSGPRPWDARPDAPGRPRSRADRDAELVRMIAEQP
jgi:hexosaminidase